MIYAHIPCNSPVKRIQKTSTALTATIQAMTNRPLSPAVRSSTGRRAHSTAKNNRGEYGYDENTRSLSECSPNVETQTHHLLLTE